MKKVFLIALIALFTISATSIHEIETLCEDPNGHNYITINNTTGVITYWRDLGWFWGHQPETIGIETAMLICTEDWFSENDNNVDN